MNKIRQLRLARHWSQSELGRRVGRDRHWVSNVEAGRRGLGLGSAVKLARALGVSVEELVGGGDVG